MTAPASSAGVAVLDATVDADAATPPGSPTTPRDTAPSALAPFRSPIFAAMWLASVVSYFGTLIQSVGASWLMTALAPAADTRQPRAARTGWTTAPQRPVAVLQLGFRGNRGEGVQVLCPMNVGDDAGLRRVAALHPGDSVTVQGTPSVWVVATGKVLLTGCAFTS